MNNLSPPQDLRARYRYADCSQRKVKYTPQSGRIACQQRVNYLPGLEVRSDYIGHTCAERLQVICAQGIRILYWLQNKPAGIDRLQLRYRSCDLSGSTLLELDHHAKLISREVPYPFGGSAVWASRSQVESNYKTVRYSAKERDETGMIYYGYRYYLPWLMRWLNCDPAGTVDGLNLFRMVRNNPLTFTDCDGQQPVQINNLSREEIVEQFRYPSAQPETCYLADLPDEILHNLGMGRFSAATPAKEIDADTLYSLALAQVACLKTQQLLPYGTQNMAVHLWQSKYNVGDELNEIRCDSHNVNEHLEKILAIGSGRCYEFSLVTYALLATNSDVSGKVIKQIEDDMLDHCYVVIGEKGQKSENQVVADSWVTFPEAHLLSDIESIRPITIQTSNDRSSRPQCIENYPGVKPLEPYQISSDKDMHNYIYSEARDGWLFTQNSSCRSGRIYTHAGKQYRFDTYDKTRLNSFLTSRESYNAYLSSL